MNQDRAAIFDANPYPVLVFDENLNLLDSNPAGLDLLGAQSFEEARGKGYVPGLARKIPPFQPDGRRSFSWADRMKYIKETGKNHFETWLLRDGEVCPTDVSIHRMLYGGIPALVLFVCEVYRVARIEQTLNYQQKMLSAVDECARMLVDLDADNAEGIIGRALNVLAHSIGSNRTTVYCADPEDDDVFRLRFWFSLVPGEESDPRDLLRDVRLSRDLPSWNEILARGESVNQTITAMASNERAMMEALGVRAILLMPISFKGRLWGGVTFEDCFNERTFTSVEIAIMRAGATLIAFCLSRLEVMQNLITAEEDALKSSRAKSFFLANMSHEIRTPINAIIGMATISRGTDDAERKEYCLQKIRDASTQLLGIINNILDMSKIEADKMEICYVDFDFEKTVRKAVGIANFRISEKNQHFDLNIDSRIPRDLIGDDQRLAQVITNLLSNAVNFTPEYGHISLSACLEEDNAGACLIKVEITDTGIGISEKQQSKLFSSFEQAENNTSRKFGGTGLGLAISKRIVELMGGRIWVVSTPGEGSTFGFVIPARRGEHKPDSSAVSAVPCAANFEGFRVLLVEDNAINREIVLALLEPTRIEIDCAENGAEAVSLYAAAPDRYSMIFMDVQMPGMDGYEATERIRAMDVPGASSVPIVAMTANVFREDIDHCLAVGMNDHIGKPLDFDEVLEKLRKYLLPVQRFPG
jgi:signal transduction histidine kinase/ActR/RegA family two-component response regulator